MKQLAWPSKEPVIGCPAMSWRKLSTNTSTEKCATEPALEVGMSEESPTAKMFANAFDCSVCLSTGT